jgi:hypothetical protein
MHLSADPTTQLAVSVDAGANQGQAGGWYRTRCRFAPGRIFSFCTCQVKFQDRALLQYFFYNFNMLILKTKHFTDVFSLIQERRTTDLRQLSGGYAGTGQKEKGGSQGK